MVALAITGQILLIIPAPTYQKRYGKEWARASILEVWNKG